MGRTAGAGCSATVQTATIALTKRLQTSLVDGDHHLDTASKTNKQKNKRKERKVLHTTHSQKSEAAVIDVTSRSHGSRKARALEEP